MQTKRFKSVREKQKQLLKDAKKPKQKKFKPKKKQPFDEDWAYGDEEEDQEESEASEATESEDSSELDEHVV